MEWITATNWKQLKKVSGELSKSNAEGSEPWKIALKENIDLEKSAVKAFEPIEEAFRESLVTAAANAIEDKPTHILFRGNPHAPGEEVFPAVPEMLQSPLQQSESEDRRLSLAKWIADESNPLTPRVAVNRIWQHHFGRGLVRSSDEFGGLGEEPTHVELLDWLANEFVNNGWKMKPLHRLIMTSNAYKMSSAPNDKALEKDPLNDHFWRYNMRRLTAEEIRDTVLTVSNNFNHKSEAPAFSLRFRKKYWPPPHVQNSAGTLKPDRSIKTAVVFIPSPADHSSTR